MRAKCNSDPVESKKDWSCFYFTISTYNPINTLNKFRYLLEKVKERVAKSQPSFFRDLHSGAYYLVTTRSLKTKSSFVVTFVGECKWHWPLLTYRCDNYCPAHCTEGVFLGGAAVIFTRFLKTTCLCCVRQIGIVIRLFCSDILLSWLKKYSDCIVLGTINYTRNCCILEVWNIFIS